MVRDNDLICRKNVYEGVQNRAYGLHNCYFEVFTNTFQESVNKSLMWIYRSIVETGFIFNGYVFG